MITINHVYIPRLSGFILAVLATPLSQAATLWTGPSMNFSESESAPASDVVLAGKVVLTRNDNQVLINTAAGETTWGASSPKDTEWAFGALSDYSTLTYKSMESMRNGDLAALILDKSMVMHIIDADIYLSVEFTDWGQHFAGGFAYTRSTPAVAPPPPLVTITSPAAGAVFAAPATVALAAAISGGSVTNVQFFAGSNLLGQAGASPFTITASLAAGAYALTAVATAGGVTGTSSVVNITVVAPIPVAIAAPVAADGAFSFNYSVNPGLSYVVQGSTNLVDWVPILTNTPSGGVATFSQATTNAPSLYYRVGLLPNP